MKDSSPSSTALLIAGSVAWMFKNSEFRHLVPPASAEVNASFVKNHSRRARLLLRALESRWLRWVAVVIERLTIPGIQLHYIVRKRFVEEVVRVSLNEGFSQIIIVGAGFDTLAYRLASIFPAARFIEVDHPATQRYKRHTLEMQHRVPANVEFLAVDLTQESIRERLSASALYRRDTDTVFVAEGVLMYLTTDEVTTIFRSMADGGNSKRRVVFTFMELDLNGRAAFRNASRAVDLYLRFRGEPFRWGISRETLPTFLTSLRFSLKELATASLFRQRYDIQDVALAEGECVCVADRSV
jgi:methyltransferase (TIGR00027 family)